MCSKTYPLVLYLHSTGALPKRGQYGTTVLQEYVYLTAGRIGYGFGGVRSLPT